MTLSTSIWPVERERERDWAVKNKVGLEEEVRQMLNVEACRQLFIIIDNTFGQLALEVLATFELSLGIVSFHCADTIQFQVSSKVLHLAITL